MAKREVELPDLPKGYVWGYDRMEIGGHIGLKLSIIRKIGWLTRIVVDSDWIDIPQTTLKDQTDVVQMNAQILMLQLPGKFLAERVD